MNPRPITTTSSVDTTPQNLNSGISIECAQVTFLNNGPANLLIGYGPASLPITVAPGETYVVRIANVLQLWIAADSGSTSFAWTPYSSQQVSSSIARAAPLSALNLRRAGVQPIGTYVNNFGGGHRQEVSLGTTDGRTTGYKSICRYPVSSPQLDYANIYKSTFNEDKNQNPIWVKSQLECPLGVYFDVKFLGKDRVEIAPGAIVRSDPVTSLNLIPKQGACGAGSTTTSVVSTLTYPTSHTENANLIRFTSGANIGTEVYITATTLDGTTGVATFTVQALSFAPAAGDTFTIFPVPRIWSNVLVDGGTYTVDIGTNTGGTFTLTFNGQTTAAIAFNATRKAVGDALVALSSIGNPAAVEITGVTPIWTVRLRPEFLPVNAQALTGSGASLTGGAAFAVTQQAFYGLGFATLGGGTSTAPYEGRSANDTLGISLGSTLTSDFGPVAMYGQPRDGIIPAIGIEGDSIITGTGYPDAAGSQGFVEIALAKMYPLVKFSIGGNTWAGIMNTAGSTHGNIRYTEFYGCTVVANNMGANDFVAGVTLVNLKAYALRWAKRINGQDARACLCTLVPRTTSTTGFITTAGQTKHANEAVRVAYNTWLRDTSSAGFIAQAGGPNYAMVIDAAPAVEVDATGAFALNGGLWKPATQVVAGTATGGSATTLVDSGAAFDSTLIGLYVRNLTLTSVGYITGVPDAHTLTVSAWTNGNAANTNSYIVTSGNYTWDGVHPGIAGHVAMGTIVTSDLADLTALPQL